MAAKRKRKDRELKALETIADRLDSIKMLLEAYTGIEVRRGVVLRAVPEQVEEPAINGE
jgi:hypothetical protein